MAEHDENLPTRPKRWILTLILAVIGLGVLVVLTMFWVHPTGKSTKQFEIPKIVSVHVDEEPFGRLELAPGDSYRPIELMEGTEAQFLCEVVSKAGKSRFRLRALGRDYEGNDCKWSLAVPTTIGTHYNLDLTYWDGAAAEPTDTLTIPVVVVAAGERIEFQALEDEKHQPVKPIAVPEKVYLYARAITHLPADSREFAALFFTADPRNGVPVLELMPVKEGEAPQPMLGQVVRFRRYGQSLDGYAFWSPLPLNLGGKDKDRKVIDLYVGLFPREKAREVLGKTLKIEMTGPDTVTVTPLVQDAAEVAKLTVNGKLLSEPLHVVRAGGSVTLGVAPAPAPAAPAPAPAP